MAISFPRAETVAVGDKITSSQLKSLADAFNARILSGLGDPTWRIHFWWHNLLRELRNGDGAFLNPSEAEWWDLYQHIDPSQASWPDAGPGEIEGANVHNPAMAFIFGAESAAYDSEDYRLDLPMDVDGHVPTTPADFWELAKRQRGAIDPDTGTMGAPALARARSFADLIYSRRDRFGNSFGGFVPSPAPNGFSCGPEDGGGASYEVYFTALETGVDYSAMHGTASTVDGKTRITYAGTCPSTDGNIAGYQETAWAYLVLVNVGGTMMLDVYPTNQWIEGPYTSNSELRKRQGGHFSRMLAAFAREFRGTLEQRQKSWMTQAFDFQALLTEQYNLAPNRGAFIEPDYVADIYPTWRLNNSAHSGYTLSKLGGSSDGYQYHDGFVLTSACAIATGLRGATSVGLYDGDKLLKTISIDADTDGNASAVVMIEAQTPTALNVRLTSDCWLASGGELRVEATELVEYKPQIWDAYLLLRMSSCTDVTTVDGTGNEYDQAKALWTNFRDYGCILNVHNESGLPGSFGAANNNAVLDATRRLSKHVRSASRNLLVGYAVESGKSVLWFRRFALGLDGDIKADVFEGIAPSRTEVAIGQIASGVRYVARGGVVYDGAGIPGGSTFTGVSGVNTFEGGPVYEYDGIQAKARTTGWSNRWVLDVDSFAYWYSDSSLLKPGLVADMYYRSNRCHWDVTWPGDPATARELAWHMSRGVDSEPLVVESPSGYSYVAGTNSTADEEMYRSCRIYEPPVEIESCVVEFSGTEERVKITLKSRLHHHHSLSADISSDVGTWSISDIRAESYRTQENAIREYLMLDQVGYNCDSSTALGHRVKPGDSAADSNVDTTDQWNGYDTFGACMPRVFFTQLVPEPYDDGNDAQNESDTPFTHDQFLQMELYLRCMCEGFVDQRTSSEYSCTADTPLNKVLDYTFESLNYDASGNRWLNLLPLSVRPDNLLGHGPLPNTSAYAEIFNQFVRCVNLLDKVRVMLPLQISYKEDHYSGRTTYAGNSSSWNGCTGGDPCGSTAGAAAELVPAPATTLDSSGAWATLSVPSGGIAWVSFVGAAFADSGCDGATGYWALDSARVVNSWKAELVNPLAQYAIPESWRDMVEANASPFVRRTTEIRRNTADSTGTPTCGTIPQLACNYVEHTNTGIDCGFMTGGVDDPGERPPSGYFAYAREHDVSTCGNSSAITITTEIVDADAIVLTVPVV